MLDNLARLRRYARVLERNAAHADDLVQDTLESAWRNWRQWRPGSDIRPWLFGIMHNRHVDHVRRSRPASELPDEEWARLAVPPAHERELQLRDLDRAIARLPDEQREILLLVVVEEMRYQDAAKALGLAVGTVMSRLHRGRERLRQLMVEYGGAEP
ncbi:sigma-70 family RNA polymerase sigma factor [Chromobacterium sp. TRC.1.1.SA]|uniref:Sigma-70 family RNA polymerase sigma factor n=1 Tax=Chromobacterium indicum TaxID=3110228 RepID=A0ABV0CJF9_9NEIS|nr:sigma-70 family RNA polymerase sigma factor [Chromobacterium piscinae]AVG17482.1 RNA polymerase subunit sigma-24 [Chromobacterium vaccinii]